MNFLKGIFTFLMTFFAQTLWTGYQKTRQHHRVPLCIRMMFLRGALALHPITGGADADNAQIGSQTEFSFWNSLTLSPPAYDSLGFIRSISGYGVDLPEVDSTTLDSEEGEFIPGLPMGKELSIVLTVNSATLTKLEAIHAAKANIDCKLEIADPTSETRYFAVTPRGYELGNIVAPDLMEVTFSARRTGGASETDPHA